MMRTILAQHRVLRLLWVLAVMLVSPLITGGLAQDFNWWQQPSPGANVTAAWQITKGSPEIVIAVLDDHINVGHPDIQPSILSSANCTAPTNCQHPILSSDGGHGTAVTNIISGQHNDYGIDGVCPECRILAVEITPTAAQKIEFEFRRLLNETTAWQWLTDVMTRQVIAGIRHARANGARVINLSAGFDFAFTNTLAPTALAELDAVLHQALDAGIVIVSAAGNKYETVLSYPAMMERVIGVGGSDLCGQRYTPDSSSACVPPSVARGTYSGSASGYGLDLLAPSAAIRWARSSTLYGEFYGTSGATPIVAGVVGLMLSVNPDLSPAEVQAILRETAVQAAGDNLPGYDEFHGYGLLDAAAAVARARDYTASYVEGIQDVGEQVASSGQDAAEQGQTNPPHLSEAEAQFRDMVFGLGIAEDIDALPNAEYQMMIEAWLRGELPGLLEHYRIIPAVSGAYSPGSLIYGPEAGSELDSFDAEIAALGIAEAVYGLSQMEIDYLMLLYENGEDWLGQLADWGVGVTAVNTQSAEAIIRQAIRIEMRPPHPNIAEFLAQLNALEVTQQVAALSPDWIDGLYRAVGNGYDLVARLQELGIAINPALIGAPEYAYDDPQLAQTPWEQRTAAQRMFGAAADSSVMRLAIGRANQPDGVIRFTPDDSGLIVFGHQTRIETLNEIQAVSGCYQFSRPYVLQYAPDWTSLLAVSDFDDEPCLLNTSSWERLPIGDERGDSTIAINHQFTQKLVRYGVNGQYTFTLKSVDNTSPIRLDVNQRMEQFAFSPDGSAVAGIGYDGTVYVWDTQRGGAPLLLRGHTGQGEELLFASNRLIISNASDRTLRFWDISAGGELVHTLQTDLYSMRLALSPDKRLLAVIDQYSTGVPILDLRSGQQLAVLEAEGIQGTFSHDGTLLAVLGKETIYHSIPRQWSQEQRTPIDGVWQRIAALIDDSSRPELAASAGNSSLTRSIVWADPTLCRYEQTSHQAPVNQLILHFWGAADLHLATYDGNLWLPTSYYREGSQALYSWNDLQSTQHALRIWKPEGGQIASFIIDMSTGAAELVIDCR